MATSQAKHLYNIIMPQFIGHSNSIDDSLFALFCCNSYTKFDSLFALFYCDCLNTKFVRIMVAT